MSLSIRTDKELIVELDHLAKMNNTDRATEARRILKEGLLKAKLELALRLYRDGTSIGLACDESHANILDFIDYLIQIGHTTPVNYEELIQEYREKLLH